MENNTATLDRQPQSHPPARYLAVSRRRTTPDDRLRPSAQRKQQKASPARLPLSKLVRKSRMAPAVYGALCWLAGERNSLVVHASRKQIALAMGYTAKSLKLASRALAALCGAGWITKRSERRGRIKPKGVGIIELLELRLLAGSNPVLPVGPMQSRLPVDLSPDLPPQWTLAEVSRANRITFSIWLALCELAGRSGTLHVSAMVKEIAELAGQTPTRTGVALKILTDAGWVREIKRGGYRGRKVEAGVYDLIVGQVTASFAPILALKKTGAIGADGRQKLPTYSKQPHELLCNDVNISLGTSSNTLSKNKEKFCGSAAKPSSNQQFAQKILASGLQQPTSTSGLNTAPVSVGSYRQRVHFLDIDPLGIPTSQVEMFRPKVLDWSAADLLCPERPFVERERSALTPRRLFLGVASEARRRAAAIESLSDWFHPKHWAYRKSIKRWLRHQTWYIDWAKEAEDYIEVIDVLLETVRLPSSGDLSPDHVKSLHDRISKLQRRLLKRRANRWKRILYREGPCWLAQARCLIELALTTSAPNDPGGIQVPSAGEILKCVDVLKRSFVYLKRKRDPEYSKLSGCHDFKFFELAVRLCHERIDPAEFVYFVFEQDTTADVTVREATNTKLVSSFVADKPQRDQDVETILHLQGHELESCLSHPHADLRSILLNPDRQLGALFRFAAAYRSGLTDLLDEFRDQAIQLLVFKPHYQELLAQSLPPGTLPVTLDDLEQQAPPPDTTLSIPPPIFTPRFQRFCSGLATDIARGYNIYRLPLGQRIDPESESLRKPQKRALLALSRLSQHALDFIRRGCAMPIRRNEDDYGLTWFVAEYQYGQLGSDTVPVMLICSTCAIDGDRPDANLMPGSRLLKTYVAALQEYHGVEVLGMVVRCARQLWIMHNNQTIQADDGHIITGKSGRRYAFQPFASFMNAAYEHYGWKRPEPDESGGF